jgi:Uma2 family endonuclease
MFAIPKRKYTLEEYFELDRNSEANFEYFNGEVFEMSGVSPNHATIEVNLISNLSLVARQKGCRVFPANLRIKVPALPTYRYPDLSVVCGQIIYEEIGGLQCLVNPVLIVEVLSESTAAYDTSEKFRLYKSIETFREYMLISQDSPDVSHFLKHNDRFWLQSNYTAGETLRVETLNFDLRVDEIYQNVQFETE